jgi:hypothetical protein
VVVVRAPAGAPAALPQAEIAVLGESPFAALLVERLNAAGHRALRLQPGQAAPTVLGGLVLVAEGGPWTPGAERSLKEALQAARSAGPRLRASPGALLASVSRRDGAFGRLDGASGGPLDGALPGLVKTAAQEWPEVRCRAFDLSSAWSDAEAASALLEELGSDGPQELGLGPAGRLTLALEPRRAKPGPARLGPGDQVLVSGGARGVTQVCAAELGRRTGARLVLLGRTPAPAEEPAWLASALDEAALKRALLEHAPAGERPTPRVLGERCRAVLAAREVREGLRALARDGVEAEYRAVDVRDAGAVAALAASLRARGPIRGLIHGAGVLRDRRLEDKRDDDLDQVLDPKLAGLRALLAATEGDELSVLGLFASVSGRFGRRGQADYALANQALVSVAQHEAASRPGCRVVAFDWGPWAGGMVDRALRAEFEREGVPLIPLDQGARAMAEELAALPGGEVELVVGAGLAPQPAARWTLATAVRLDAGWPVLRDHQLAGRPVLPLAMTLEWFAQAAGPDTSLEDVRVLRGVTLSGPIQDVAVWRSPAEPHEAGERFQLELRGNRDQVHVRATAVPGRLPRPDASALPGNLRPFVTPASSLYGEQLFHGPSLQVLESIDGLSEAGMTLHLASPTDPRRLLPHGERWSGNPAVLDGVFQALIVWCRAQKGAPSLPAQLGALRQWAPFPAGSMRATVRVRESLGATVVSDVDLLDDAGRVVARLEGYVCTVSPTLDRAFGASVAPHASALPTA